MPRSPNVPGDPEPVASIAASLWPSSLSSSEGAAPAEGRAMDLSSASRMLERMMINDRGELGGTVAGRVDERGTVMHHATRLTKG